MGDIADPENDRVGIEKAVGKVSSSAFWRDQTRSSSLRSIARSIPNVEHVLIDVGTVTFAPRSARRNDVASAAGHVEDGSPGCGLTRRTNFPFHSRCIPDMASFITSYFWRR